VCFCHSCWTWADWEVRVLSDLGEIEGEEAEWQSSVECGRGSWRGYSAGSQSKNKEQ